MSVTAIRTHGDLLVELARDGGLSDALDADVFQRVGVALGVRVVEDKTRKGAVKNAE